MRVLIAGSGTWGTALAHVARQAGADVTIHCRSRERAEQLARGQHGLLPDSSLGAGFEVSVAGEGAIEPTDVVISAVPTQMLRSYLAGPGADLPRDAFWVSASKGLERETLLLPTGILSQCGVSEDPAVISGPSHAAEVLEDLPTAVVIAHPDGQRTRLIQEVLGTATFRIYRSFDRVGVEWAGALKNVVALGCGIAIGRGFGDNTVAALVTRGTAEISRLGSVLGGDRETFSGLAGIGDLVVTCFSGHSRNRGVGFRLGSGEKVGSVLESMEQVAEGVPTCQAVHELCARRKIDMPIAETVYRIVHDGLSVEEGVEILLTRRPEEE